MKHSKEISIIIKEKLSIWKQQPYITVNKGRKQTGIKTVDRLNIGLGQAAARIIKHNKYLKKNTE